MKEGSRRRADAWTVWKVQLPYAIQLCEVSSRLELSLFDDKFEPYSKEGYRVWLKCQVVSNCPSTMTSLNLILKKGIEFDCIELYWIELTKMEQEL